MFDFHTLTGLGGNSGGLGSSNARILNVLKIRIERRENRLINKQKLEKEKKSCDIEDRTSPIRKSQNKFNTL